MTKVFCVPALFTAILTAACVPAIGESYLAPGQIIDLSSGTVLPMGIQTHPELMRGQIKVNNPKTGESFDGTYTRMSETRVTELSKGTLLGNVYMGTAVQGSNVDVARATLVGSKGTILNIKMNIEWGQNNNRWGVGEAEDNKGVKYSVQF